MRLRKKEKEIIDKLDRLMAGQQVSPASTYLEEKLFQVIDKIKYTQERQSSVWQLPEPL